MTLIAMKRFVCHCDYDLKASHHLAACSGLAGVVCLSGLIQNGVPGSEMS